MSVKLSFYVQPGAKRTEFAGYFDSLPKIKLAAPAQDNKANQELIAFLAKKLGLPKASVAIVQGLASRHKVVAFDSGLPAEQILNIIKA